MVDNYGPEPRRRSRRNPYSRQRGLPRAEFEERYFKYRAGAWHEARDGWRYQLFHYWISRACPYCGLIRWTWKQLRIFFSRPKPGQRGIPRRQQQFETFSKPIKLRGEQRHIIRDWNQEPGRECQCIDRRSLPRFMSSRLPNDPNEQVDTA